MFHNVSHRSDGSAERIRFLEKSFTDSEALNVALTKDLAVLRQEHNQVVYPSHLLSF